MQGKFQTIYVNTLKTKYPPISGAGLPSASDPCRALFRIFDSLAKMVGEFFTATIREGKLPPILRAAGGYLY